MYRIAVIGMGYVGLSNAALLSQHNKVIAVDIIKEKIDMINQRKAPIADKELEEFFDQHTLDLEATLSLDEAFDNVHFIFICTPTDYDKKDNRLNTSTIESIVQKANEKAPAATIVIKSTIPIGYTLSIREKYNNENIFFSPEFLREGKALYDNLYPSRIIVGSKSEQAKMVAELLHQGALKKDVPILLTGAAEAEAIKLFANTYLALRVAFFNELDTYALSMKLNTNELISGISLDPRIGDYYNNPSFGYGGYCLPKDTKQLAAAYEDIPNSLISAVVSSNQKRKEFIVKEILKSHPQTIGFYRLIMKAGSDNFRQASIMDIMDLIKNQGVGIIIYEPQIMETVFDDSVIINDFEEFKAISDIIVANRWDASLGDVKEKVYTRDIYGRD